MKQRRVLFVADILPVGGSEIFLLNLLNGLDREAVSPVVVSLGPESDPVYRRLPSGIPKYSCKRRWKYDPSPAAAIARRIIDDGIDTVFCLGLFCFSFVRLGLRSVDRDVRIIISLHSTKPRSIKEYLLRAATIQLLAGREEIITVCLDQQEYFIREYGIDRAMITTIYNGIDTAHWVPPPAGFDRGERRGVAGIPRDAVVILSVAMFRPEKRHDIMIEAFRRLPGSIGGRPVVLLLVGGGDDGIGADLRRRVHDSGLDTRVIFTGTRNDVRPYYWMADLFTLASTSETLSLSTLESLSTGLPVVVSDVGGASEMVLDGVNGILVRPGSREALADGLLRGVDMLGTIDRGRLRQEIIRRFNLRDCLRSYRLLLEGRSILERGSDTPDAGASPVPAGRNDNTTTMMEGSCSQISW